MRRLEGKSIFVAGAGGIGNGLARRYASEGAGVLLGDRDPDGAAAVAAAIVADGGRAEAIALDGADETSIEAAVARCCDLHGGLDGIHVNYASFSEGTHEVGLLDMAMADFDATMRIDLRGYTLCARAALPRLIARGGGAIVFTSSAAVYRTEMARVAYAMAKQATHALMRHIALRYGGDGIRANCIAPGGTVHGGWSEELLATTGERIRADAALKTRLGAPHDIAAMGALLMSDDGAYITGQILSVDGGLTMRA